ncbi:DinB family protein [Aquimarina agarivorans]|uniref:DinB family protein n=1 Tax=Aquimarina agarivorans TaxID=980584 RepID=UPI000248FCAA|nr:DinB family protein [Aquimarina agarivorans]
MEDLKRALEITKISRKVHYKILNHYTLEELNYIPSGFKNNLFWNIAHIMVTQQLLVYVQSGLNTVIDETWINLYRKGTSTKRDATKSELDQLKKLLFTTIEATEKAIEEGKFKKYDAYMTSTGFELKKVNDAFEFNNFHEGIHLGYILALKKAIPEK